MGEGGLVGTCHCGRVSVTLPRRPDQVTLCNCSLCTKTGFRGVYFAPDEVVVEGELDTYVRGDLRQAYLANQRCKTCGVLTHWTMLGEGQHKRMGINARLFGSEFDDLSINEVDGASWDE